MFWHEHSLAAWSQSTTLKQKISEQNIKFGITSIIQVKFAMYASLALPLLNSSMLALPIRACRHTDVSI